MVGSPHPASPETAIAAAERASRPSTPACFPVAPPLILAAALVMGNATGRVAVAASETPAKALLERLDASQQTRVTASLAVLLTVVVAFLAFARGMARLVRWYMAHGGHCDAVGSGRTPPASVTAVAAATAVATATATAAGTPTATTEPHETR